MDPNRFIELLEAYLQNLAGEEDQQELFLMISSGKYDDHIADRITKSLETDGIEKKLSSERAQEILKKILAPQPFDQELDEATGETDSSAAKVVPFWRKIIRFGAAAAVLLLFVSLWFIFRKDKERTPPFEQVATTDLQPGKERAVLTLADGTVIPLDSLEGNISKQGDVTVINMDGRLSYETTVIANRDEGSGKQQPVYNTITTPRGGQYQLVLADGSKVWLNAASSLRFPVAFTGNERKVELKGEGFFEVVHNANKPFLVTINGTEVHDLGTAFNINGYDDEQELKVTLVEGKARVNRQLATGNRQSAILTPGKQAVIANRDEGSGKQPGIQVQTVDVTPFISWKENKFYFDGSDIHSLARQLSRWYDVDVEIKGNITDHFTGIISRKVPARQVFEMLEKTGAVRFNLEGKKIIISK
jgi:ferric-dicitrate binding protein FerR (iron transport regulator)